MAKRSFLLAILGCLAVLAQAQQGGVVSFSLNPSVNLPIGTSAGRYTLGGGAELTGEYSMPFFPPAFAQASLNYNLIPSVTNKLVNTFSLGIGPGIRFPIVSKLYLGASVENGLFAAVFEGKYSFSYYLQANAGLSYRFVPSFSVGAGVSYKHHFAFPAAEPLFQGLSAHLDTSFHLGGKKRPELKIRQVEILPVFPVFFKYYDDNPLGKVVIRNEERGTIRDVTVSLFVPQFMDSPKQCIQIKEMKRDQEMEVPLYALFTENVLNITEGTKSQADIVVEYTFDKERLAVKQSETMRLNDRNAMTWDDDRKTAAFVTAKDPTVLRFAKQVAGLVRREGAPAVEDSLLVAMGLHEALALYGLRYVPDPTTPYIEYSQNISAVDFLQFPNQTLQYRAGDCDDLSILYCALLEAVGIETAFVAVPGHIYIAFVLEVPPDRVSLRFSRPEDVIVAEGKAWIPLEVTSIDQGFMKAWDLAAREWRRYQPTGEAVFYTTREAWKLFEAVGFQAPQETVRLPDDREVMERFHAEKERLLEKEMLPQVQAVQERLKKTPGDPRYLNALGTIYAKYGLFDQAEEQYRKAISQNYAPAIANMGNVLFLRGDTEAAQQYYLRALKLDPERVAVLINLAKTYWEMENYEEAQKYYNRARELDPVLPEKYRYLESERTGGRAAEAGRREVDWAE